MDGVSAPNEGGGDAGQSKLCFGAAHPWPSSAVDVFGGAADFAAAAGAGGGAFQRGRAEYYYNAMRSGLAEPRARASGHSRATA